MVVGASEIQGWWRELWALEGRGAPAAQSACPRGLEAGAGLGAVPELTALSLPFSLFFLLSRCRLGHLAARRWR